MWSHSFVMWSPLRLGTFGDNNPASLFNMVEHVFTAMLSTIVFSRSFGPIFYNNTFFRLISVGLLV